ncbi:S8 family serine peptidase [uncultured Bacteroides sp.]|uniref:S8 family peptidase n=1 Tax=uncultured Bacteroides sp. TaxID=162156 RepID=UPI00261F6DAD|nr:S8 family serine peptidase [uncultured Bacteroides sp.]
MAGHTFFGKQKLCYTEVSDFTDYQGIGHDPLYKRYDSVASVVKRVVPEKYHSFLATPEYIEDSDQICWHIDKWDETPTRLSELQGLKKSEYERIKSETIAAYNAALQVLEGEDLQILAGAIRYIDDERIYCTDNKVFVVAWGMTPDTRQHKVIGSVIHEYNLVKKYKITFDAGEHGSFSSKMDSAILKAEKYVLSARDLPNIIVDNGWDFAGWIPEPIGHIVNENISFTAEYNKTAEVQTLDKQIAPPISDETEEDKEQMFTCHFLAGEHGTINGSPSIRKIEGSHLRADELPLVMPHSGYTFVGWSDSPLNCTIDGDKTFVAMYDKVPWYKRGWLWLTGLFAGKGCLRWLLWLLLFLLVMWLLLWLLRDCKGNHAVNGVVPVDTITCPDGRVIDDNGWARPITGSDGTLPDNGSIVAPIMGEGGTDIPVIEQPGVPNTIANRLFLFMEDENDNVEALAKDFKAAYPEDRYSIIGYDKEVKLLVIQMPADERDRMRQTLNSKIPNHKFIVFDEEIYELNGRISSQSADKGWHLDAIHLKQGWSITKGSRDIKIAVVDDGIEASHPMFKGRIVDAYNVFTQNNTLSLGEGHGTHTAALAGGSADYYSQGASGVAPECMIMPIQVFDNKQCPLSALIAGVMYAVHHDADVVNISIGPSFKGLDALPVEQQDQIAKQQFKNVEKLWTRVCTLAASKNCVLVFAAGNDDILSSVPPQNRNLSAIVVAAVDKNLYPTDFTNYGPCSDISAPGKNIYSAYPHGSFQSFDGTSMAAPLVTGTIALMKSLKKDLTTEQVRNCLYNTGADVYGWMPPMVLVDEALQGVKAGKFFQPKARIMKPVPDGDGDRSATRHTTPIVEVPVSPNPALDRPDETDYDAIRRKIAEYKEKINELEKLLPKK